MGFSSKNTEYSLIHNSRFHFTLMELIFVGIMSGLNVVFDLIVSIPLKLLLSHVITGIFIMVPVNFGFMLFTKYMVDKHGTLTFYLIVFSLLSIPTAMLGGIPGAYKILIGGLIGIGLDLVFWIQKPVVRLSIAIIAGAFLWWVLLFMVWQFFSFPFISAFGNMLNLVFSCENGSISLKNYVSLPIIGFGRDFFLFSCICGGLSTIPCILGALGGFSIFGFIKKTALYSSFHSMQ